MSRFLVTCWPFVSHVLPQMSIASALRERGAEVAFYTGSAAHGLIEREGFSCFAFRRVDEAAVDRAVRELEVRAGAGRPRPRDVRRCFDRWLVDPIADQVADLCDVIEDWRPDALVCDLSMWGPIVILSETTTIPVALSSTFMGPLMPARDAPPPGVGLASPKGPVTRAAAWAAARATDLVARRLRARVDGLRAVHGLPPMGCPVNAHMGRLPLTLIPCIRELDYGRRDVPASVHYVGPCLWHPPARAETTRWLDQLPDRRPWVHVCAPTMAGGDPFVLRAATLGLSRSAVEVIGTLGGHAAPEDLGPEARAPNVHLAEWVSHAELLPRCAAVVTSGGTGTIMAALTAGVPLVVVPTTWDKPDNAQRVVEAGVGVRLSPRRCTPERLRAAVERVLSEPQYAAAARRVADRLQAAPGPAGAAQLLETLIRTGRTPADPIAMDGAGT
jgi:MGT family glycosyltransferase